MNIRTKVLNMSALRRLIMAAAFSAGLWDRRDLYLGSSGNHDKGNPQYAPKRTKFKGWQRQARDGGR